MRERFPNDSALLLQEGSVLGCKRGPVRVGQASGERASDDTALGDRAADRVRSDLERAETEGPSGLPSQRVTNPVNRSR